MNKKSILILYNEVMGYLLSGIKAFYLQYPDIEIHLFELDANKLTPFRFTDSKIIYYKKSDYNSFESFKNICDSIDPTLLIVSGRSNNHYLRIAKLYKHKLLTVSIQDSQDDQGLKTFIKSIAAPVLYHPYFSCIWTIGPYGLSMAHKLGYKKEDIYNYCYSADTEIFNTDIKQIDRKKQRQILYVGRFSDEKNIKFLINAFQNLNDKLAIKWKLNLVGEGDLVKHLSNDDNVKVFPFQSALELKRLANESDIFCLPSLYEPWGVVVHEFAALGKALLISSKCGSRQSFLIDGFNGYSFDPSDESDFKKKLNWMVSLSDDELYQFKINSILLSQKINTRIWAAQLYALFIKAIKIEN